MTSITLKSGAQPYEVEFSARGHQWLADEPPDNGGGNKGPTPFELLLSSIGSCVAITIAMYARRKEWPLERVAVELQYERLKGDSGSQRMAEIRSWIRLDGDLSSSQKARLIEIGGRCPVKRALEGDLRFETELRE